ncbi:hypothetical protein ElyMa_004287100 [Elysia marginata]|uniref:Uncharacterized protein n=1 Tax=Elysia marginata TaxID=1093978 RepID=A0AAV4GVK2_9GAST|nr:hypothetical protein ElyMa_004287100 [Elysia marginata]
MSFSYLNRGEFFDNNDDEEEAEDDDNSVIDDEKNDDNEKEEEEEEDYDDDDNDDGGYDNDDINNESINFNKESRDVLIHGDEDKVYHDNVDSIRKKNDHMTIIIVTMQKKLTK